VAQWLDWEAQANLVGYRTSTLPLEVSIAGVPQSEVRIHRLPGLRPELLERFLSGGRVWFAKHPLNRDPTVAYFDAPEIARWRARFTSSRTLAFPGHESGEQLFSLKLATDHPHPAFHQPEKTKLREEALGAVDWARLRARVDRLLGPLRGALIVPEVLVVLVGRSETGFMVRDLSLFEDGHYYLPALSIPWVGRQIARRHAAGFDGFWGRHYAATVGRLKARLLARYGLWYETPNPQNVVVQLDHRLHPTGHLVFRDLGDAECATDAFERTRLPWSRMTGTLRPETENSFWAFGEADTHAVRRSVLERWYRLHDGAYFGELARWFPALAPTGRPRSSEARRLHWETALRSRTGAAEVSRAFRERIAKVRQA
jgi:hypothetical protein